MEGIKKLLEFDSRLKQIQVNFLNEDGLSLVNRHLLNMTEVCYTLTTRDRISVFELKSHTI